MLASGPAGSRECQGEAAHPMNQGKDDRSASMRGRARAAALFAAVALSAMPAAVRAEGPLYLRIRPNPVPDASIGSGQGRAGAAGQGREAGRETVWERADRRARTAIASVCTGCLDPRFLARPVEVAAPPVRASRPLSAALAVAEDDTSPFNPSPAGDP
ncbi:hypothetical protein ASG52_16760 [Methylobacterium sp. Leaf456]|nr:hypothetical protein ASG52_16760 [Methylobacterium sp. Leaf456]